MLARLAHITDLHFGPSLLADRIEALQLAFERLNPDLIVVSGDLVQRAAFPSQFLAVRDFLRALPAPVFTVPGNHELSLLNPLDRLLFPYLYYRRYIDPELEGVRLCGEVLLIGVNSTKPYLVHHGYTSPRQLRRIAECVACHPRARARIAVTHHPLARVPGVRSLPQLGSARTLRHFASVGIDLVLCGHYHSFAIVRGSERTRGLEGEVYLLLSGSASSDRIRRPHQRGNSFSVIEVHSWEYRIVPYWFEEGEGFVPAESVCLHRADGAGFKRREPDSSPGGEKTG